MRYAIVLQWYSNAKNLEILNTYTKRIRFTMLVTIESRIKNLFQTRLELFRDISETNFSMNLQN